MNYYKFYARRFTSLVGANIYRDNCVVDKVSFSHYMRKRVIDFEKRVNCCLYSLILL